MLAEQRAPLTAVEEEVLRHGSLASHELARPCLLADMVSQLRAIVQQNRPSLSLLYGPAGAGHRTVLAHATHNQEAVGGGGRGGGAFIRNSPLRPLLQAVVLRFCGLSEPSTTLPALLRSIYAQVCNYF